jgi:bifunctional N-acetylglucosamine-1-phosphate-uridyltransferase/glucosamine-1-phosphate-acetyltransferase GlmU-like protein
MENQMKELLKEIAIASKSHPDLSLVDLITMVAENKYQTRLYENKDRYTQSTINEKWSLTNYDLLQAFKQHNRLRQYDKQATNC